MNVQKIRHPLALLREQKGMTHGAYALLVAQTHAELGFGSMAGRREKVARWESGRITPEVSAQLAMAHLHGVPRTEVERLGWPDWLYTATGHSEVLSAPWTYGSAVEAMNRIAHASPRATEHRYGVLSCADGIADLCAAWLDGAAGAEWLPAERGQRIAGSTVAVLEDRQKQLHHLYAAIGGRPVQPLADSELRMVSDLIRNASCDQPTGARLLGLAADAATFAGWLAVESGDQTRAQSAFLTSMRCAAAAGDTRRGAYAMLVAAKQKIDLWDLAGTSALLDAARRLCASSRPSPRMLASLASTHALVAAMEGDADAVARHLDATFDVYAAERHEDDLDCTDWVTPEAIRLQAGFAHAYLGGTQLALDYLLPLCDHAAAATAIPDRDGALGQVHIALAHASAGDGDTAVQWAVNIPESLERSPSFCVESHFQHLLAKLDADGPTPVVRDFLQSQRHRIPRPAAA
ncbi:hypothetical protein A8W25_00455 [Streptomyces sp. ERV7]|uniref:helix-turn-helix domain-containing protein n=1 Tax=Streptomyces sp. ERV7 TaxID=1322334 RepID=UPI0007F3E8E2|nr:helix-turn-helix domain-containing protein [Streptomyces sp. ERV7]OAR26814.1 hypothetical protein A8W25_00455 [Streptomyces sp. ERV7]